jgi:hypothetical protein
MISIFFTGFLSFCLDLMAANDLEKSISILDNSCSDTLLEKSLHIFASLATSTLEPESTSTFAFFLIFCLFEIFRPILFFWQSLLILPSISLLYKDYPTLILTLC